MSSPSPKRLASWLPLFAAAIAGGWTLGYSVPEEVTPAVRASRSPSAAVPPLARRPPHVVPASPAIQWVARVKKAAPAGFPALFKELAAIFPDDDENYDTALHFLFGQWVSLDTNAAIAFAGQQDDGDTLQRKVMTLMVRTWPEKAAALLFGHGDDILPPEIKSSALSDLAKSHPDMYLKSDPEGKSPSWDEAVRTMIDLDPAAAAAACAKRGGGTPADPASGFAFGIGAAWAKRDSGEARRWADSLPEGRARQNTLHGWLSALAHVNPRAALQELSGCHLKADPGRFGSADPREDSYCYDARQEIAGRLAMVDFPAALATSRELALQFPHENSGDEPYESTLHEIRRLMIEYKGSRLPAEPLALLAGLEAMARVIDPTGEEGHLPPEMGSLFFRDNNCVARLSAEDSLTAARLRLASGASGDDDPLLNALLCNAAKSNPVAALDFYRDLPPAMRNHMAALVVPALPPDDTEHLSQLLRQLPSSAWEESLVYPMWDHMAEYEPIISALPADECSAVRVAFARQWAQTDPRAAAAWVATLQTGSSGAAEARTLAEGWAGYDEAAASEWVAGLESGPARDSAAAGLVRAFASPDPETAWKWAASISCDEDRVQSLTVLAGTWEDAPAEFRAACVLEGIKLDEVHAPEAPADPFASSHP